MRTFPGKCDVCGKQCDSLQPLDIKPFAGGAVCPSCLKLAAMSAVEDALSHAEYIIPSLGDGPRNEFAKTIKAARAAIARAKGGAS